MGVPDKYPLPSGYNDAYHLFGDGVVIPVVRWLNKYLLLPLSESRRFEQVSSALDSTCVAKLQIESVALPPI
jgi:hypothetical protein